MKQYPILVEFVNWRIDFAINSTLAMQSPQINTFEASISNCVSKKVS